MRTYEIETRTEEETSEVGKKLCEELQARGLRRCFIALYGEMGVGKTAFVRGFASAVTKAPVRSPTYTIVNEYRGGALPLFHFDMYRIESEDDLCSIAFYDYLAADGYALCEWSENIPDEIPADAIRVHIERGENEEHRRILIERKDEA